MNSENKGRNFAIWMSFLVVSVAVRSISVSKCIGDFSCEYNYYCYKQSGRCIQCLDCSLYNRMMSDSQNCHHTAEDCGACLPGFSEEYLAQQVKREACVGGATPATMVPTTTTTVTTTTQDIVRASTSAGPKRPATSAPPLPELIIATATVFVACIATFNFISFYVFKLSRWKNNSGRVADQNTSMPALAAGESTALPLLPSDTGNLNDSTTTHLEQPPLYSELDPEDAIVTVSEERSVILHIPEARLKESPLNDAVPWRDADYLRSSSLESLESDENTEVEPNYPAIHDEETIPSAWEPTPDHHPRNLQESTSPMLQTGAAEASSTQSAPSVSSEQPLDASHPSPSSDPAAPAVAGEPPDRPFRHLSGGDSDDDGEPTTKRLCQEDVVSLGSGPDVSAAALHDHDRCSSLTQGLSVIISQLSSSSASNPNVRHA